MTAAPRPRHVEYIEQMQNSRRRLRTVFVYIAAVIFAAVCGILLFASTKGMG